LLAQLGLPEPWQGTIEARLRVIDELEHEINDCERELRRLGADHRYVPLLLTVPGIGWVLAYTIAASSATSNASRHRGSSPATAAFARVSTNPANATCAARSANKAPRYLRRALVEAATHACTHAIYRQRYQQATARIGKQRGAKVAQIDLARRLSEAIWHMLSRNQTFAPKGATDPLAA
jgi:transposase